MSRGPYSSRDYNQSPRNRHRFERGECLTERDNNRHYGQAYSSSPPGNYNSSYRPNNNNSPPYRKDRSRSPVRRDGYDREYDAYAYRSQERRGYGRSPSPLPQNVPYSPPSYRRNGGHQDQYNSERSPSENLFNSPKRRHRNPDLNRSGGKSFRADKRSSSRESGKYSNYGERRSPTIPSIDKNTSGHCQNTDEFKGKEQPVNTSENIKMSNAPDQCDPGLKDTVAKITKKRFSEIELSNPTDTVEKIRKNDSGCEGSSKEKSSEGNNTNTEPKLPKMFNTQNVEAEHSTNDTKRKEISPRLNIASTSKDAVTKSDSNKPSEATIVKGGVCNIDIEINFEENDKVDTLDTANESGVPLNVFKKVMDKTKLKIHESGDGKNYDNIFKTIEKLGSKLRSNGFRTDGNGIQSSEKNNLQSVGNKNNDFPQAAYPTGLFQNAAVKVKSSGEDTIGLEKDSRNTRTDFGMDKLKKDIENTESFKNGKNQNDAKHERMKRLLEYRHIGSKENGTENAAKHVSIQNKVPATGCCETLNVSNAHKNKSDNGIMTLKDVCIQKQTNKNMDIQESSKPAIAISSLKEKSGSFERDKSYQDDSKTGQNSLEKSHKTNNVGGVEHSLDQRQIGSKESKKETVAKHVSIQNKVPTTVSIQNKVSATVSIQNKVPATVSVQNKVPATVCRETLNGPNAHKEKKSDTGIMTSTTKKTDVCIQKQANKNMDIQKHANKDTDIQKSSKHVIASSNKDMDIQNSSKHVIASSNKDMDIQKHANKDMDIQNSSKHVIASSNKDMDIQNSSKHVIASSNKDMDIQKSSKHVIASSNKDTDIQKSSKHVIASSNKDMDIQNSSKHVIASSNPPNTHKHEHGATKNGLVSNKLNAKCSTTETRAITKPKTNLTPIQVHAKVIQVLNSNLKRNFGDTRTDFGMDKLKKDIENTGSFKNGKYQNDAKGGQMNGEQLLETNNAGNVKHSLGYKQIGSKENGTENAAKLVSIQNKFPATVCRESLNVPNAHKYKSDNGMTSKDVCIQKQTNKNMDIQKSSKPVIAISSLKEKSGSFEKRDKSYQGDSKTGQNSLEKSHKTNNVGGVEHSLDQRQIGSKESKKETAAKHVSIQNKVPATVSIQNKLPATVSIQNKVPTTVSIQNKVPTTVSIQKKVPTTVSVHNKVPTTVCREILNGPNAHKDKSETGIMPSTTKKTDVCIQKQANKDMDIQKSSKHVIASSNKDMDIQKSSKHVIVTSNPPNTHKNEHGATKNRLVSNKLNAKCSTTEPRAIKPKPNLIPVQVHTNVIQVVNLNLKRKFVDDDPPSVKDKTIKLDLNLSDKRENEIIGICDTVPKKKEMAALFRKNLPRISHFNKIVLNRSFSSPEIEESTMKKHQEEKHGDIRSLKVVDENKGEKSQTGNKTSSIHGIESALPGVLNSAKLPISKLGHSTLPPPKIRGKKPIFKKSLSVPNENQKCLEKATEIPSFDNTADSVSDIDDDDIIPIEIGSPPPTPCPQQPSSTAGQVQTNHLRGVTYASPSKYQTPVAANLNESGIGQKLTATRCLSINAYQDNTSNGDEQLKKSPSAIPDEEAKKWVLKAKQNLKTPPGTNKKSGVSEQGFEVCHDKVLTNGRTNKKSGVSEQGFEVCHDKVLTNGRTNKKSGVSEQGFEVCHDKVLTNGLYEQTYAHLHPKYLYPSGRCLKCQICSCYFTPLTFTVHHDTRSVVDLLDIEKCQQKSYEPKEANIIFWNAEAGEIFEKFQDLFKAEKSTTIAATVTPEASMNQNANETMIETNAAATDEATDDLGNEVTKTPLPKDLPLKSQKMQQEQIVQQKLQKKNLHDEESQKKQQQRKQEQQQKELKEKKLNSEKLKDIKQQETHKHQHQTQTKLQQKQHEQELIKRQKLKQKQQEKQQKEQLKLQLKEQQEETLKQHQLQLLKKQEEQLHHGSVESVSQDDGLEICVGQIDMEGMSLKKHQSKLLKQQEEQLHHGSVKSISQDDGLEICVSQTDMEGMSLTDLALQMAELPGVQGPVTNADSKSQDVTKPNSADADILEATLCRLYGICSEDRGLNLFMLSRKLMLKAVDVIHSAQIKRL